MKPRQEPLGHCCTLHGLNDTATGDDKGVFLVSFPSLLEVLMSCFHLMIQGSKILEGLKLKGVSLARSVLICFDHRSITIGPCVKQLWFQHVSTPKPAGPSVPTASVSVLVADGPRIRTTRQYFAGAVRTRQNIGTLLVTHLQTSWLNQKGCLMYGKWKCDT